MIFKKISLALTLALYCTLHVLHAENYVIEVKNNSTITQHDEAIVLKFRTDYFKGWPYFYDATVWLEEEKTAISQSLHHKDGLLAVAKLNDKIVGFITGSPLNQNTDLTESESCKIFFAKSKTSVDEYYYYGDVIVDKEHRGKHLVTRMFQAIDAAVQQLGYKKTSLVTAVRSDDDPRKPNDPVMSEPIWQRFGFVKSDITIPYTWPTFTTPNSTRAEIIENLLAFWTKDF